MDRPAQRRPRARCPRPRRRPRRTLAVIRAGRPNAVSPSGHDGERVDLADGATRWWRRGPCRVSISSRTAPDPRRAARCAPRWHAATSSPVTTLSRPARPRRWSASRRRSVRRRIWVDSRSPSPASRAACSIIARHRAGAPAAGGPPAGDGAEQAHVRGLRVGVRGQLVVEVGLDLEQLQEVRVERAEQVVDGRSPTSTTLTSSGIGSGSSETVRQAQPLTERLDADLACPQRPLELLPRVRLGQQPARVEHQVPAVGAMEGAGADQCEVGHQGAELGDVLHAPDQVGLRRRSSKTTGAPIESALSTRTLTR